VSARQRAGVYSLHGSVYGCSVRTGRQTRLGSAANCIRSQYVARAVVAGSLTAYSDEQCGVDTGSTSVIVRGLRTGRRLSDTPATTLPGRPESFSSLGSLVLRESGAVAWIVVTNSIAAHSAVSEVDRVEGGRQTRLDSGAGIVAGSLRLRGSTLSWRHGSATRTATLL
jgi:hypothetical protein